MKNSERHSGRAFQNLLESTRYTGAASHGDFAKQALALLNSIESGDDMEALESVTQLCFDLSVAPEEAYRSFPVESALQVLVQALTRPFPEISNYSVIAINHILDCVPNSGLVFAGVGGVNRICEKLLNFEYIDTAEHIVKTLDHLAKDQAILILREGAFTTIVNMIDFFEYSLQKKILATATNLVKHVYREDLVVEYVFPVIPTIANHLAYKGEELLELSELSLEFFLALAENLNRLMITQNELFCANQLLQSAFELLPYHSAGIRVVCFAKNLCLMSPQSVFCFLQVGGLAVLKKTLEAQDEHSQNEALQILDIILPNKQMNDKHDQVKLSNLKHNPEFLVQIGDMFFKRVFKFYEKNMSKKIRILSLRVLEKLMTHLQDECLVRHTTVSVFANFLSEVLSCSDLEVVKLGLSMVNLLYTRIPFETSDNLIREGVTAKLHYLSSLENAKELVLPKFLKQQLHETSNTSEIQRILQHSGISQNSRYFFQVFQLAMQRNSETTLSKETQIEDILGLIAQDVLVLVNQVLLKEKEYSQPSAYKVLSELKELAKNLRNNDFNMEKFFEILQQGTTPFELLNSGFLSQLWNFLVNSFQNDQRVYEFVNKLSDHTQEGSTYFECFEALLLKTIRYTQQFQVYISDVPINSIAYARTLSSRLRVKFEYNPHPFKSHYKFEKDPFLRSKHKFFKAHSNFELSLEEFQTLDVLVDALLRIQSKGELSSFVGTFERTKSDYQSIQHGELNLTKQQTKLLNLLTNSLEELGVRNQTGHLDSLEEEKHEDSTKTKSPKLKVVLKVKGHTLPHYISVFEAINTYAAVGESLCVSFYFKPLNQCSEKSSLVSKHSQIEKVLLDQASDNLPLKFLEFLHLFSMPSQVSHKLTALLKKQIDDLSSVLGGMVPDWLKRLPKSVPFLFSFEERLRLFRVLGFTGSRRVYFNSNKGKRYKVRLLKQKALVPRSDLLRTGFKILKNSALLKYGVLEFDFENEEGTGLGPTLEFYSLISKEIRKLSIWRDNGQVGLFPAPLQSSEDLKYFGLIGRLVAKTLYDEKLVDLPLSPVFWKLVLKKDLTINDLVSVDPDLGKHILELSHLVEKKDSQATFKGASVESLELYFELPGYEIELKPFGKQTKLTIHNLQEYIQLVTEFTLMQRSQAEAFRKGFEKIIPAWTLEVFEEEELEHLICGYNDESWDLWTLRHTVHSAHGYTKNSTTVQNLLKFMSDLQKEERRSFLEFVTGCPRLPLGGFKGLHPPLTVVKKTMPGNQDEYLPSVMTCQNYLKLPDYSSYEVLARQLLYAMKEGSKAFHLS